MCDDIVQVSLVNSFVTLDGCTDLTSHILTMSVLLGVDPVKHYNNFYSDRATIRKDHKGKVSAIYLFYKLDEPSKCYVGQSSNVVGRINNYLNNSFLNGHKNRGSRFIDALLKYGQSAFGFIILEYVSVTDLGPREIYWISVLKPYYNSSAGGVSGSTGATHSQDTKDKLRDMQLGRKHSDETKALISQSSAGTNNGFFGAKHTAETLLAMSKAKSTGMVYVYNLHWDLLLVMTSTKMVTKFMNVNFSTVVSLMESGDLFRGGWYFTRLPISDETVPKFVNDSSEAIALFDTIKGAVLVRKPVFVFDADTLEFVRAYNGVMECAKDMKVSHNTIKSVMASGSRAGKYLFSPHRVNKNSQ